MRAIHVDNMKVSYHIPVLVYGDRWSLSKDGSHASQCKLFIDPGAVEARYIDCKHKLEIYTTHFTNAPHPQKCPECAESFPNWEYDASLNVWKREHPDFGKMKCGQAIHQVGLEGDPWSLQSLKVVPSSNQDDDALVFWTLPGHTKITPTTQDVVPIWPSFHDFDREFIVNEVLVVLKKGSILSAVDVDNLNRPFGSLHWDGQRVEFLPRPPSRALDITLPEETVR